MAQYKTKLRESEKIREELKRSMATSKATYNSLHAEHARMEATLLSSKDEIETLNNEVKELQRNKRSMEKHIDNEVRRMIFCHHLKS